MIFPGLGQYFLQCFDAVGSVTEGHPASYLQRFSSRTRAGRELAVKTETTHVPEDVTLTVVMKQAVEN